MRLPVRLEGKLSLLRPPQLASLERHMRSGRQFTDAEVSDPATVPVCPSALLTKLEWDLAATNTVKGAAGGFRLHSKASHSWLARQKRQEEGLLRRRGPVVCPRPPLPAFCRIDSSPISYAVTGSASKRTGQWMPLQVFRFHRKSHVRLPFTRHRG